MVVQTCNYLGKTSSSSGTNVYHAHNPVLGQYLPEAFHDASKEEVDIAVQKAIAAFDVLMNATSAERASFLREISKQLNHHSTVIAERGQLETALPEARLRGELGRTTGQLNFFADLIEEGSWMDIRIDKSLPSRTPLPRPDIRHMKVAMGPVGIFGASNFPLAFSVAGGDTASALAAGCPVIVKAHPAHPGTSDLVAQCILEAAQLTGMPDGIFSMVHGHHYEVGEWLVTHPGICAIGFTGSFKGGTAIYDLAQQRKNPIPVYAEMGSINPVFFFEGALTNDPSRLAAEYASSITLGVGQFCTNPGISFVPNSPRGDAFVNALSAEIKNCEAGTMLTEGIRSKYEQDTSMIAITEGIQALAESKKKDTANAVHAKLFSTQIVDFNRKTELSEEVFGPSSILIRYNHHDELLEATERLKGHLTASIHATTEELVRAKSLILKLQQKVGRLIFNQFPTGVEVCDAMVHGGPYPATSDGRSTSVGGTAINRFTRPVCFQNFPEDALPEVLREDNSRNILRKVDGKWHTS
jgi:NADP-dependent aldehyde dehydrogenase